MSVMKDIAREHKASNSEKRQVSMHCLTTQPEVDKPSLLESLNLHIAD